MARSVINKHVDNESDINKSLFENDPNRYKGELVICNSSKPSIYIMDSDGNPRKVSGGGNGEGGSYDDTEIWNRVNMNTTFIEGIDVNSDGEAIITKDIKVAGLDSKLGAGNYSNGNVISSGTSIYTILQNILCKELFPTNVTKNEASLSVSMKDLTLITDIDDEYAEVGTIVTLLTGSTNGYTVTPIPSRIKNMEYGYSYSTDGEINTDKSIESECRYELNNNRHDLTLYLTGITSNTGIGSITNNGDLSYNDILLGTIGLGSNIIELKAFGPTFTYSSEKINKVYYCSNLGKRDENHTMEVPKTSGTTSQPSKVKALTINGRYKYFMGYSNALSVSELSSDDIRNLEYSDWINIDGITYIVGEDYIISNGKSIVIACQTDYILNTIQYSIGSDMSENFENGTITVKNGDFEMDYIVYIFPISNNTKIEFKNVTLSKK